MGPGHETGQIGFDFDENCLRFAHPHQPSERSLHSMKLWKLFFVFRFREIDVQFIFFLLGLLRVLHISD